MLRSTIKYSILILFFLTTTRMLGQDFASLPRLIPSYSEDFSDYHSYPSICFEKVFFDANGKMWLLPCGNLRNIDAVHLYQFDGYDFKFAGGDWEQFTKKTRFAGLYQKKELVGIVRGDQQSQLFFFDLEDETLRMEDIDSAGQLEFLTITKENRIFLVTEKDHILFFYEWIDQEIHLQGQYLIPDSLRTRIIQSEGLYLNEEEFWFKKNTKDFILRINKKTGTAQKITAADFPGNGNVLDPTFKVGRLTSQEALPDNEFYIYQTVQNRKVPYKLNLTTNQMDQVQGIPSGWSIEKIAKDEVDNNVFLFTDQNGRYQSILETPDKQRFNYSALFANLNNIHISHFQSADFREKIIISHNRGLLLQQVKTGDAIQHFIPSIGIQDIEELPGNRFIVGTHDQGFFLLDPQKGSAAPFRLPGCPFHLTHHYSGLTTDSLSYKWFSLFKEFIQFNPFDNNCKSIPLGQKDIVLFTFINNDQIAVVTRDNFLYLFDLSTQQSYPFTISGKPLKIKGRVHDLYADKKDKLWLATNEGLLMVNLKSKTVEILGKAPPFRDFRIVCIEPDTKGRLWLGSSLYGLQIFDPTTGEVLSVTNQEGLSNNKVVSILEDDDGDRWLATYNGISIVDQNGRVLANLSEEDGLIEKENNRLSSFKAKDGRLIFGTINGLHIIDPKAVKGQLRQQENLKMYLTSLEYYNTTNKADEKYTQRLNKINTIELPASKRYLNLEFALSNYFKPEENQYAYMLKGLDEGWTDLGNHHVLSLNNLPAGRYELLIKGGDENGNWSEEPLQISIYAKEFFYKKTSFYLLVLFSLLGIVSGIAWLWISRLRVEVKKATHQIQKDKELIEKQALRLMDIDKAKSIFFTNISHEFRTPLTVISGIAGKLSKISKERLEHSFNMIRRNSDNLLNLVNQILDLRKLESGKLDVEMIQGDVIPYLRYIFESFESLAQNKDIQAHLIIDQPTVVMDYDKKKLLRIVSNLLSNAIKFTPEGGDIYFMVSTLGVLETPRVLTIKVRDNGIGIPNQKLPHIFDRFYQVDGSSTRVGEGTGIGLALCKELVSLLGGEIKVDTEEGVGTTFTLNLPITQSAEFSQDSILESTLQREFSLTSAGHATKSKPLEMVNPTTDLPLLLVIEDNLDVVQYLITCLEDQYRLVVANDGEEGIIKAIEVIPDAIISDVMMPKKDGFEVCLTLKTDERTSHIPIILLTAKADMDSRISGLKKGADDYLVKPFNEEELLTRLENQMQIRQLLQLHFQKATPPPKGFEEEIQQENNFLLKIKDQLEAHLDDEDYGILQICHDLGMSRTQLHRKVKALTGQSTSHYLRRIRLTKGKELLETTDLNISEIAYEVGFRHPSYFTRSFTAEFGVAPNDLRN